METKIVLQRHTKLGRISAVRTICTDRVQWSPLGLKIAFIVFYSYCFPHLSLVCFDWIQLVMIVCCWAAVPSLCTTRWKITKKTLEITPTWDFSVERLTRCDDSIVIEVTIYCVVTVLSVSKIAVFGMQNKSYDCFNTLRLREKTTFFS